MRTAKATPTTTLRLMIIPPTLPTASGTADGATSRGFFPIYGASSRVGLFHHRITFSIGSFGQRNDLPSLVIISRSRRERYQESEAFLPSSTLTTRNGSCHHSRRDCLMVFAPGFSSRNLFLRR